MNSSVVSDISSTDETISAVTYDKNKTHGKKKLKSLHRLKRRTVKQVKSFFKGFEDLINGGPYNYSCDMEVEVFLRKLCVKHLGYSGSYTSSKKKIYDAVNLIPMVLSDEERTNSIYMWEKKKDAYNLNLNSDLFIKISSIIWNTLHDEDAEISPISFPNDEGAQNNIETNSLFSATYTAYRILDDLCKGCSEKLSLLAKLQENYINYEF
ncbi:hypothetical protein WA158_002492 [Blastocystis sp. Blastoise]